MLVVTILALLLAVFFGSGGLAVAGEQISPGAEVSGVDAPGEDAFWAGPVWNGFNELLGRAVCDGLVDYALLAREAAKLDAFLALLATARPEGMSREQSLAFHIDLYNAATLRLILTKYPDLKSIKDLGSWFERPWSIEFVDYARGKVSLDFIEREVLRRRFADPRIHFALNCSARSCPPLRAELYFPERIDEQLDDACRTYVNNPEAVFVREGELFVSKIFRWYADDFEQGAEAFVRHWAGPELLRQMDEAMEGAGGAGKLRVRYLSYDWSLNDLARVPAGSGVAP